MLIRFVKKLKPVDFARITSSLAKMEEISSVLTTDFLATSLKLGSSPIKNRDEGMIFNSRSIGPFVNTKYEMQEVTGGITCNREALDESDRPYNFDAFVKLEWGKNNLEAFGDIKDVLLTVDGNKDYTEAFIFGNFTAKAYGEKQLFNLASFFYRRRALYKNIYEVLSKNKGRIEQATNSVFADNLVALFAVKGNLEKVAPLKIPKENLAIVISADHNNPYQVDPQKKKVSYCVHPNNPSLANVKLSFEAPDYLQIEFTLSDYCRGEQISNWLKENKKANTPLPIFDDFIAKHLNSWLKNILQLSVFQAKLYEQVKTKILLEQI